MDHKKPLMTLNPIALQHLFDETLFKNIEKGTPVVETITVSASTEAPQSIAIAATEEFIIKGTNLQEFFLFYDIRISLIFRRVRKTLSKKHCKR